MPLAYLSLSESADLIRAGKLSPVELTEALLRRIEALQPRLNAFITVTAETALAEARAAEELAVRKEFRGRLHGVPVALKDLYDVQGVITTAGSVILKNNRAAEDSFVAARLRAAGAVFLGKTLTHEWALGTTSNNPHFGPTRNPWNPACIPGGSSGGNGAGLAAGMFAGSMGSDTGGSIRIPASLCGVVGLKPTRGRVSLRGVTPLAWTLDHAGPMTRSVGDAALMLNVVAGYDPLDPASVRAPEADFAAGLEDGVRGMRIGVPGDHFWDDLHPEVGPAVRAAIGVLSGLGAEVRELPPLRPRSGQAMNWAEAYQANVSILLAEAAAVHADHLQEMPESIGEDVLARLHMGEQVSGPEYAAARRRQAEWIRKLELELEVDAGRKGVDVIVTPTTAIPAAPIEGVEGVTAARLLTRLTAPFNLTGLPAISVPCGFTRSGLPIGLQIVGPAWGEAIVLRAARAYEAATPWGERRPSL